MTNHSKTDFSNELSDAQVSAMLMKDLAMIADDGFVNAVTQRVHRRVRNRKIVLGMSAFVGGLIGFGPLKQLGTEIAKRIETFSVDWQSVATLSFDWSSLTSFTLDWQSVASLPVQTQWLIAGVGIALLTPVITKLLDN
ncbi:MAG: hypothetical protein O7D88_03040 [Gammaproteobacteria bacterium]|nr:hypothetical protein [Gammaproteobacteria bacterium]MCZ6912902.1 hypothetical protein [Pseudomonadota bacterium]